MNRTRAPKAPRSSTPSRGGIRKRGAPLRADRDGDLDMDGGSAGRSGRGGGARGRGRSDHKRADSGRGTPASNHSQPRDSRRHNGDKDKTLDAIQKAIYSSASTQANVRQPRGRVQELARDTNSRDRSGLEQLSVRGWKQSKAASNADGGIESLVAFLEKKGTPADPNAAANLRVRVTKSRVEGDALIISVRPEHLDRMYQLNGFLFAGAPLTIEDYKGGRGGSRPRQSDPSPNGSGPSQAAVDTKTRMMAFLHKRYRQPTKVLDLSALASDQDLVEMGMFSATTTESKFFPALMKVCELSFLASEKKEEAVTGVTLANNQLLNVSFVTTLSQTFPELKNLDLSNNKIKDTQSLVAWRWKFRNLEFLDLSGNPVSAEPGFKETMLKWYPKLTTLNNTVVRTAEEIAAQKKTPIPVLPASFQDDSQIAENFVRAFFVGYDNNRNDLLNGVYDAHSTFSLSINATAPRAQSTSAPGGWDHYIRKSRNLLKISHLPARVSRSYVGAAKIGELWQMLPKTRHPDILANPTEWLIECHPLPGLPDPTGNSTTGVGGLIVMAHGKFDEVDLPNGEKGQTRSFDRTFVLGPGGGLGGLRVVTDMLCLRAYGGSEAWIPDIEQPVIQPQPTQSQPVQLQITAQNGVQAPAVPPQAAPPQGAHPQAKDGYGMATPGKTAEQVQREQMTLEISFRTKMTLEFSDMALSGNGWNLEAALKNFEELKTQGKLPPNAFLQGA
ncbi:nuclear mRNA export, poly(A)+RNA binding protein [Arachnomyces sp. PD_36]|nr:nuclear mRNA export, poly(A)+RNA binding protein [Arachnomyces sp. PD_36]